MLSFFLDNFQLFFLNIHFHNVTAPEFHGLAQYITKEEAIIILPDIDGVFEDLLAV